MIKLIPTAGTYTANAIIPLTIDFNSNPNTSLSNNAIQINKAGFFEINSMFNVTATGTSTNMTLYANGVAIPETSVTLKTTAADNCEIVINNIERIVNTYNLDRVKFTFVTTTGLTIIDGNLSVKEIR